MFDTFWVIFILNSVIRIHTRDINIFSHSFTKVQRNYSKPKLNIWTLLPDALQVNILYRHFAWIWKPTVIPKLCREINTYIPQQVRGWAPVGQQNWCGKNEGGGVSGVCYPYCWTPTGEGLNKKHKILENGQINGINSVGSLQYC